MKEIEKKGNLKFNFALYIKQDRHNLLYYHFTYSKNYSYLFSKKKKNCLTKEHHQSDRSIPSNLNNCDNIQSLTF